MSQGSGGGCADWLRGLPSHSSLSWCGQVWRAGSWEARRTVFCRDFRGTQLKRVLIVHSSLQVQPCVMLADWNARLPR